MCKWASVLELNAERAVTDGSHSALCDAIRRGADLRIATQYRHNEHEDITSDNDELVKEVAEFRVTYLLEDRWTAGIMTLRQPFVSYEGFGPRPSMSFFMYNQNGQQAVARPFLDGQQPTGVPGPSDPDPGFDAIAKYHQQEHWDAETNAPSQNFIYEFDSYRFFVSDDWREEFSHRADGTVVSGSCDRLVRAFERGLPVKVAIRGLCNDLVHNEKVVPHEVFVETNTGNYWQDSKLFIAGTHPVVRVRPGIPLAYTSQGWDFGWLVVRTDGVVFRLLYDPYSLRPQRSESRHDLRWFVRR